jgi:hypothetical protein
MPNRSYSCLVPSTHFEGKEDVHVQEWVARDPHGKYIFVCRTHLEPVFDPRNSFVKSSVAGSGASDGYRPVRTC